MSSTRIESAQTAPRLRGRSQDGSLFGPSGGRVDAEVFVPPSFWLLLGLAALAALLQATLVRDVALRGGHLSLLTILIVWAGLRCGVTTGGWLGLFGGLLEDALGGGGVNVLGATLAGFGAGLLSNRFFSDSIPVFTAAVAGATILRAASTYVVVEIAFGERGFFHRMAHAAAWQIVLNAVGAVVVLLALRIASHARVARLA